MTHKLPSGRHEKWIILSDTQLPFVDLQTLNAVEAFIKDVQASDAPFTGWLQLGDLIDFPEISRWYEGKEDAIEDQVEDSFQAGLSFLTRHRKLMGPKAEMVLIEGNHDFRPVDFLEKNGNRKWRKTLDYARRLNLDGLKVKWIRAWRDGAVFKKGNAHFVHGKFTNSYHAKKMVDTFGVCIYYGHTHDVMEIPRSTWGNDKTLVGKSLGCLCDYKQKYMRGSPSNWQQAIAIFTFFEDGHFQEETIKIFKHRFYAREFNKIYDGRILTPGA